MIETWFAVQDSFYMTVSKVKVYYLLNVKLEHRKPVGTLFDVEANYLESFQFLSLAFCCFIPYVW